jgi:hypothetical protein
MDRVWEWIHLPYSTVLHSCTVRQFYSVFRDSVCTVEHFANESDFPVDCRGGDPRDLDSPDDFIFFLAQMKEDSLQEDAGPSRATDRAQKSQHSLFRLQMWDLPDLEQPLWECHRRDS